MRISEFFESNYKLRKLRGRAENTVRLYRYSIKNLERTLGKIATLDDFTDDTILLVMQAIVERGGSPYSANKERSQLLAMWRYAAQLGLVSKWPTVTPEREPERIPIAWLQDDVHKLMKAIAQEDKRIGDVPARIWWRGIVSVCLDTGERIGAIAQCQWSWLEGGWLLVPAEARKGRKRDRRYSLSQDTLLVLSQIQKYPIVNNLVFYWPYHRTYLWTRFTKLLKDAGLPHGRKDKFHRLRKTLGSVAYAAGLDAQDILDHQSKRTTQAYLDPRFSREVLPSKIIADWLRNPPPELQKRHG